MTENQPTPQDVAGGDKISWLEYKDRDFPFYNGSPIYITAAQWCFILVMVAQGFALLIAPITLFHGKFVQFIPAILFVIVPLAGLYIVTPKHWTALFRPIAGRDILWMLVFVLLNIVVSFAVGILVSKYYGASSNPAIAELKNFSDIDRLLFYLKTLPQLVGEEILSILPFLALLTFFYTQTNTGRIRAVVYAWLLTALWFGAAHLPTYDWNFVQCFLVIGSARLILLLPYIMTKNLWISSGAHIMNDWIFFSLTIFGASLSQS